MSDQWLLFKRRDDGSHVSYGHWGESYEVIKRGDGFVGTYNGEVIARGSMAVLVMKDLGSHADANR